MSQNSGNNDNIPFNRDKFLRALFRDLRKQALDYKAKKEGTSDDLLTIGPKPLMYEFFVND